MLGEYLAYRIGKSAGRAQGSSRERRGLTTREAAAFRALGFFLVLLAAASMIVGCLTPPS